MIKDQNLYPENSFVIIKFISSTSYTEIVKNFVKEEKAIKVITYKEKYEDSIRTNFMKTYGTIGMEYINQIEIKKQRGVMSYMIKKIGANLLTGKSIMNVSLPIYIFESRSIMEIWAFNYSFAPTFLKKAAQSDPVERLKLVYKIFLI